MAVYEYECEKCGVRFEIHRGIFQDKEKAKCPVCGEPECRQVYSGLSARSAHPDTSCAPRRGG